jgi:hypothetical protein
VSVSGSRRRRRGERVYVTALFRDPCAYCGTASATLDHISPAASGGRLGWSNLVGACEDCNQAKRDRTLLFYLLGKADEPEARFAKRIPERDAPAPRRLPAPLPRRFVAADLPTREPMWAGAR